MSRNPFDRSIGQVNEDKNETRKFKEKLEDQKRKEAELRKKREEMKKKGDNKND